MNASVIKRNLKARWLVVSRRDTTTGHLVRQSGGLARMPLGFWNRLSRKSKIVTGACLSIALLVTVLSVNWIALWHDAVALAYAVIYAGVGVAVVFGLLWYLFVAETHLERETRRSREELTRLREEVACLNKAKQND